MKIYQTRKLLADGVLPSPAPAQDLDGLHKRLAALGLAALVAASFAFAPTLVRFVRTAWAPSPLGVEEIGSS